MADITVRRGNGNELARSEWDPFRVMRDLMRWDPFREMMPLVEERGATFFPAFEIRETRDGYHFRADLPGIKDKDVEVSFTGHQLTIGGKRETEKEEKGDRYYACERSYGSFTRSFTLPEGADVEHCRAELKDGVLSLVVPKKPGVQPRKIEVKAGEKVKS